MDKNKFFIIMIILIIFLNVSLLVCAEQEKKTVVLSFAHPYPSSHHKQIQILEPLFEEIKEKSNGRIIINIHPGGSLSTGAMMADDMASGAVDGGWTQQGYYPGRFLLTSLFEFSGMWRNVTELAHTMMTLLETNEAFQEEYNNYKIISLGGTPPGSVYTAKQPIHGIEDFKGKNLRVSTTFAEELINSLGGVGTNIPMSEVYDALERGIIDGECTDHTAIETYSHHEVIKYAVNNMSLFTSTGMVAFSMNTWNKLSPEDQELIESCIGMKTALKDAKMYDDLQSNALNFLKNNNIEIYEWTEEDTQQFIEIVTPMIDKRIEQIEAKGIPARQFYNEAIEIRDNFRNKNK
ncbi:MAG: TRAP transporter substrate-binding protein [Atribacterota bacterium]|nr:TRAP transporter substrate-binding protein [Atribacterota bacterium]MDD4896322.1 TRAP transporter substrate-binding protein [Atribacterota bacterium]MDD5638194.1 TRAP transporter substrate-binding protein [Atribacterota bacterium]